MFSVGFLFPGNSWVLFWETETLASREIVFPKTGTQQKVWDHSVLKLPSNNSQNHENLLFWCLVRPDSVKFRGNKFVWSMQSSWTPLNYTNFNLDYCFSTFCSISSFPIFTVFWTQARVGFCWGGRMPPSLWVCWGLGTSVPFTQMGDDIHLLQASLSHERDCSKSQSKPKRDR